MKNNVRTLESGKPASIFNKEFADAKAPMGAMLDCHVHSSFSHDGKNSIEEIVLSAIAKGLKHIAITDHCEGELFVDSLVERDVTNADDYCSAIEPIKQKYASQIYVSIGIECGFDSTRSHLFKKLLEDKRIEYVINSIHIIKKSDPYINSHFFGKTKDYAFNEFLSTIEESLYAPYRYNTIGHLSYISRTAPYPDSHLRYHDYKAPLDRIFKKMINDGTILELNSGVYNLDALCLPEQDLITAYYNLGGRNITLASDAHTTTRLADKYHAVASAVRQIGFTDWTVIQNGTPTKIEIK